MDFQGFVNTFAMPCAVLSVKKNSSGHCEEIRIVAANDFYKETMGVVRYRDNMLYSELVPKDLKFEDFCYRSAVLKKKMHAYVETRGLNAWTDWTTVPLGIEESDLSYCAFFFEFTRNAEAERMSMVSPLIADSVIKNCIHLRTSTDFLSGLQSVINEIQEKSSAFCCSIFLIDKLNKKFKILCDKFKNNVVKAPENSNLTYEIVSSWEKTIGVSNGIIVKDEYDMRQLEEKNPRWFRSLRADFVENLILYPLVQNKKHIGYLSITNFDTKKLVDLKELIELTTLFLSSEIENHILLEKLEHLSNTDILTGVKNRSAMNQRVDSFVRGEKEILAPFAVIFVKILELKQMNDDNGHDEGDILLKKAAALLREIFPTQAEIYRSGGDEFMILLPACHENEFRQKVRELREKSSVPNSEIRFAIGTDWNEEGKKLRRSMHIADEEMYKEKDLYDKISFK